MGNSGLNIQAVTGSRLALLEARITAMKTERAAEAVVRPRVLPALAPAPNGVGPSDRTGVCQWRSGISYRGRVGVS